MSARIQKLIQQSRGMSLQIIDFLSKNKVPRPYPEELQNHVKDCLAGYTLKDIENYVCGRG